MGEIWVPWNRDIQLSKHKIGWLSWLSWRLSSLIAKHCWHLQAPASILWDPPNCTKWHKALDTPMYCLRPEAVHNTVNAKDSSFQGWDIEHLTVPLVFYLRPQWGVPIIAKSMVDSKIFQESTLHSLHRALVFFHTGRWFQHRSGFARPGHGIHGM